MRDAGMKGAIRILRLLVLMWIAGSGITANAAESSTWGPSNGTTVVIDAQDQNGTPQTLASLSGSNGLLIFFNRSADW
ncbi:MAG: hypothetical protein FJ194_09760 [Gammaproteobacteria bacterium]|nr:hypothetical protein [Gammaproteobacteria bacterium]